MANQPVLHQQTQSGSPYCSDPNCKYCKQLREEQLSIIHSQEVKEKAAPKP